MKAKDKITDYTKINIWHYLSLPKFLDFIENLSITFSRSDTFDDKNEGIHSDLIHLINQFNHYKRKYNENEAEVPYAVLNDPFETINLNLIKEKKEKEIEILEKKQKQFFISSWFVSDYESISMWNLYSQKEGVAIKTTVDVVLDIISEDKNPFRDASILENKNFDCGYVKYCNLKDEFNKSLLNNYSKKDKFKLYKRKDVSYKHEEEFRFIIFDEKGATQEPISKITINKPALNKFKVIAHPLMPDWQFKNLKEIFISKILLENFQKSSIL